jgi:glutamyl-tRNA synthetase
MMQEYKTRFAPSPTGYLHLGNLRTALFNALFAYRYQGDFLLRIEDTDQVRSTSAFTQAIIKDLQWLGLYWSSSDESQNLFLQSQRHDIYQQYYNRLCDEGYAYPCFCTEDRLNALREEQRAKHQPPGYDGYCRTLSSNNIKLKKDQGESYHLRFKIPQNQKIIFHDLVKGEQQFNTAYFHDFVIRRSDGSPTFLYCNAIDDVVMGISHVLRGEDHLSNTAKQLLVLRALKLSEPQYGHLPLISLQDSTTPLSKREGSFNIHDLRNKGYLPSAIINYLARLGHTIANDELMEIQQLAQVFSLEALHHSSAHFDLAQLNFWQKKAIQCQKPEHFWGSLGEKVHNTVPQAVKALFIEVMQSMVTFPEEAQAWAQLLFQDPLHYTEEAKEAIQLVEMNVWSQIRQLITDTYEDNHLLVGKVLKDYLNRFDGAKRKLYWRALRAALTNTFKGPELISIIQLLGIERTCKRLSHASALN